MPPGSRCRAWSPRATASAPAASRRPRASRSCRRWKDTSVRIRRLPPNRLSALRGTSRRSLASMTARLMVGAIVAFAATSPAPTAEVDAYKGKTITLITSTGVGGTYDLVARLVARHMPRFIPGNPGMIVQNMPGGGNVLATNYMYNIAPQDGTAIATVHNAMPLHQVLDGSGVRYDARKFNWLGSTGPQNEVILVWHTAGIKTIKDAMEREVILGG